MVVGRLRGDTTVEAAERRLAGDPRATEARLSQTPMRSARSACARSRKASAIPARGRSSRSGRLPRCCSCWWRVPTSSIWCSRATPNASASSRCASRLARAARRIAWQLMLEGLVAVGRRGASGAAARVGEPAGHARDDARHDRSLRRRMALHAHGRPHVRRDRGACRRRDGHLRDGAGVARRPPERHRRPAARRSAHRRSRPAARPRGAGRRADRAHARAAGRRGTDACQRSIA